MKKVVVTILALIYLVTSTGAAVTVHYCMGKVSSVTFLTSGEKHCGSCGMKTTGGCCKDETKAVKISDSHKTPAAYQDILPLSVEVERIPQIYQPFIIAVPALINTLNNSPPRTAPSRCILYCIFRI